MLLMILVRKALLQNARGKLQLFVPLGTGACLDAAAMCDALRIVLRNSLGHEKPPPEATVLLYGSISLLSSNDWVVVRDFRFVVLKKDEGFI